MTPSRTRTLALHRAVGHLAKLERPGELTLIGIITVGLLGLDAAREALAADMKAQGYARNLRPAKRGKR